MRTYRGDIERVLGFIGPATWLQQEYGRLFEAAATVRAYEEFARPHLQMRAQLDRLISVSSLQSVIARSVESPISQYIDKYGDLQSLARRVAELNRPFADLEAIRRLQRMLDDSLLAKVSFAEDGLITVDGQDVDIVAAADELEAVGEISRRGASALDALVTALQALGPYVRAVVLYVLLPYLISIIANINTPMHEEWWKSMRGQSNRQAAKGIKAQAMNAYSLADLEQFRFVKSALLHVRSTNNIRSPKLEELSLGKTVRLLKRERGWSFVEYSDVRTPELKQGWVLSRYLARFDQ